MIGSTFQLLLYLDNVAHRHPRLVPSRVRVWICNKLEEQLSYEEWDRNLPE